MHPLSIPATRRLAPVVPVVLRLAVGSVMAVHGWQKLTEMGPAMFGETMVADLGLPAPVALGWAVTLIELVGGVLLVAGLLTRVSGLLLALVLAGTTILVKVDLGLIAPMGSMLPGAELDLALLAGALAVLVLGPGRPSLDHLVGIEGEIPVMASATDHAPAMT
jgi:putative oxidoreductase